LVSGRKVVGSAQLRQGGALLQHGSILLADGQRIVRELMAGAQSGDSSTRRHETDGEESPLFGSWLTLTALTKGVALAAARRWRGNWSRVTVGDEVIEEASRHYPRFRSPAWTWAR
jgi:hypothetical protein